MNYESIINLNNITIQDCINLYALTNKIIIVNDGKIIGFADEDTI